VILLWGPPGDDPLDAVTRELARRGDPFMLLDQRDAPHQRVELTIGAGGDAGGARDTLMDGAVWSDGRRLALGDVAALYMRTHDAQQLGRIAAAGPAALARARSVDAALWAWAEESPARVVNRPSAMASNGSKPYQLALLQACGFRVPATLVTTDPAAVSAFCEQHGTVIYKSASGVRSIVARLAPAQRARLDDVAWCPTQFQAWVPGVDHRVHVIGDDLFAVEIRSDADDYRYARMAGAACELRAVELPHEVAARARAAAAALKLAVTGIDLRRTPDGEWYCFEANPSPAFTYYEHHTGQPLAAALASFLAAGRRGRSGGGSA
jgi:RimK-like ATP-grasp domain